MAQQSTELIFSSIQAATWKHQPCFGDAEDEPSRGGLELIAFSCGIMPSASKASTNTWQNETKHLLRAPWPRAPHAQPRGNAPGHAGAQEAASAGHWMLQNCSERESVSAKRCPLRRLRADSSGWPRQGWTRAARVAGCRKTLWSQLAQLS